MDFILAIAKSLLSNVGARIFAKIFPTGVPDYYGQVLNDIQKLLVIETVSNDITLIQGKVNGLISLLTINYPNLKKTGQPKTKLIDCLSSISTSLDLDVMGPLEALADVATSKGNAQQSLLAYMFGGSMQLAVLQEMALEDPEAKTPSESAYAADLQEYAANYAVRAQMLLSALKASRMGDIQYPTPPITVVSIPVPPSGPPGGGSGFSRPGYSITASFLDNWIGNPVCVNQGYVPPGVSIKGSSTYQATNACGEAYVTSQAAAFDAQWANATQAIAAWTTLSQTPFPPPPDFTLALANGLLSSCGASMLANVFPLGLVSYFGVILQQTAGLMHVDDVSADLTNLQAPVDHVINQMLVDYPGLKIKPATTKQDLIAFLSPLQDTLKTEVMTPLQALADNSVAKGNAQQSLLAYLFCGGLLIAVLQEMALQDPQAASAGASQYADDVKSEAALFEPHATNLFTALENARLNSISAPQVERRLVPGAQPAQMPGPVPSGEPTWPLTTYVEDGWLNAQACLYAGNYPIGWSEEMILAQTAGAREDYLVTVYGTFQTEWASVNTMTNAWSVVQMNPLPFAAG